MHGLKWPIVPLCVLFRAGSDQLHGVRSGGGAVFQMGRTLHVEEHGRTRRLRELLLDPSSNVPSPFNTLILSTDHSAENVCFLTKLK